MFGNPIHGYLPFVSGNVSFDFPCAWAMVVRRQYDGHDKPIPCAESDLFIKLFS